MTAMEYQTTQVGNATVTVLVDPNAPAAQPIAATRVTALDALLAIDAAGLAPAYEAWANAPERTFAQRAFISKAQFWRRDDPTLAAAANSLGLSDQDVDALFAAAAQMAD